SFRADQARPRTLVEGKPELGLRNRAHHGFVKVFDSLDEMRLAEDEVGIGGELHADGFEFEHEGLRGGVHMINAGEWWRARVKRGDAKRMALPVCSRALLGRTDEGVCPYIVRARAVVNGRLSLHSPCPCTGGCPYVIRACLSLRSLCTGVCPHVVRARPAVPTDVRAWVAVPRWSVHVCPYVVRARARFLGFRCFADLDPLSPNTRVKILSMLRNCRFRSNACSICWRGTRLVISLSFITNCRKSRPSFQARIA